MPADPGFCGCGGYWQVFANGTFCKSCGGQKITPLYLTDQPGGRRAVEHGCTCPVEQPRAMVDLFTADKACPLHGLGMAKVLFDA